MEWLPIQPTGRRVGPLHTGAALSSLLIVAILAILLLAAMAHGQSITWEWMLTPTVQWDLVAKPDPGDDPVRYIVHYRSSTGSGQQQYMGPINATSLFLESLPINRLLHLGVQSVRWRKGAEYPVGAPAESRSTISWSNDPAVTNSKPFGVATWPQNRGPVGIKVVLPKEAVYGQDGAGETKEDL